MFDFISAFDAQEFLIHYGYLAILVATFLEGESIVILGGIAASQGHLTLCGIILAAFCGSFTSDQLMFYLGKNKGPRMLAFFPRLNGHKEKVAVLLQKYDIILIFGFRFVYGIRNITPIMLGICGVALGRFFLFNFLGAVVWAFSFTLGGYYFGHAVTNLLPSLGFSHLFIGVCAILLGIVAARALLRGKKTHATPLSVNEPPGGDGRRGGYAHDDEGDRQG